MRRESARERKSNEVEAVERDAADVCQSESTTLCLKQHSKFYFRISCV